MACVADKIVAAPFAVLGSIGVITEVPNGMLTQTAALIYRASLVQARHDLRLAVKLTCCGAFVPSCAGSV